MSGRRGRWAASSSLARLVILSAVLLLALPAAASAQQPTDPVTLAVARAKAYWHTASPCAEPVRVALGEPEPSHAAGGVTVMWSTFTRGTPDSDCVVHLNPKLWPSWREIDLSFGEFCQTMAYEFGHFLGHRDEGEYPGEAFLLGPQVPECRTWQLYYGPLVYTSSGQRRTKDTAPSR